MRVLGRLIVVPLALVLAALGAMAVLLTIGQEQVVTMLSRGATDVALLGLFGNVLKLALVLLTPQVAVVPLLIAIGGEVAHIRAPIFYVAAFGAFGGVTAVMAGLTSAATTGLPLAAVCATAGFAAGVIYWLIAGRGA